MTELADVATSKWYQIANFQQIESPALLVYPERVAENLNRIIAIADDPSRLWLHIKTHKMCEVIRLAIDAGVSKFKAATIAEAELVASSGGSEVLLAYPLVGPNTERFAALVAAFPQTRFLTLGDDAKSLRALSETLASRQVSHPIEVLIDLDTGMHRSGVAPGPQAVELYQLLDELPFLSPGGLHIYDGQFKERDFQQRCIAIEQSLEPVNKLREDLAAEGLPVPHIIAGGTPTFPVHARNAEFECSPGTCVFWDTGYESKFPDLDFLHAAVLLTRVISKPTPERLCLDLGYKAVASDNPDPRVRLLDLPDAKAVVHNEEHLTVESPQAANFSVGDVLYGVPFHICPTTALHKEVVVVERGVAIGRWQVAARDRKLSF